jgi:hypothetical protein
MPSRSHLPKSRSDVVDAAARRHFDPNFVPGLALLLVLIGPTPSIGFQAGSDATSTSGIAEAERGYLGFVLERSLAESGFRVTAVLEGSPAHLAGFRAGDLVVGFDGSGVEIPDADVAFVELFSDVAPGARLQFEILRSGVRKNLLVIAGRVPEAVLQAREQRLQRARLRDGLGAWKALLAKGPIHFRIEVDQGERPGKELVEVSRTGALGSWLALPELPVEYLLRQLEALPGDNGTVLQGIVTYSKGYDEIKVETARSEASGPSRKPRR